MKSTLSVYLELGVIPTFTVIPCFSEEVNITSTEEKRNYSERLQGARGFSSSPWASDGKVFCLDERGLTFVLKAGPEFKVLATNKLDETFWSSAAISGNNLLLRGVDHLYCIAE